MLAQVKNESTYMEGLGLFLQRFMHQYELKSQKVLEKMSVNK